MEHLLRYGDDDVTVAVEAKAGGAYAIRVGDRTLSVDHVAVDQRSVTLTIEGKTYRLPITRSGGRVELGFAGRAVVVERAGEDDAGARGCGEGFVAEITAPMPGKVLEIPVEEGAELEAGAPVIVLEAMKMEQTIRAGATARVTGVSVAPGDMVGPGEVMIRLEPLEDDDS